MGYKVTKTACYPNAFHLVHKGYMPDNAGCNFFPSMKAAEEEAKRRGWHTDANTGFLTPDFKKDEA